MRKIQKKIEKVMTDSGKSRPFSFEFFLFMISMGYAGGLKLRQKIYRKGIFSSKRLPCRVISIGNITVGGTGKTPMTIYVAELVSNLGYNVAIVSRGYKGGAEKTGGIVSDGRTVLMGPDDAGDEPLMMAKRLKKTPVVVGQDRFKAGMIAIMAFNPDVLVLDDAFQHLKLARDIDLVLLDSSNPLGNTHLLPRGTLREPASSLWRSDAFLLTRSDDDSGSVKATSLLHSKRLSPDIPVFKTIHLPYIHKIVEKEKSTVKNALRFPFPKNFDFLNGRKVFAFSGIAGNHNFRRTLEEIKCDMKGFLEFPDHHRYSDKDFRTILQAAKNIKADVLITTEKDYTRIAHRITWPIDLVVIGIEVSFGDDEVVFNAFIKKRLSESS